MTDAEASAIVEAERTLATISATNDQGWYAKVYLDHVPGLISIVRKYERELREARRLAAEADARDP